MRELLEILADPTHPQHNEQLEWLGDDFDPRHFPSPKADAALVRIRAPSRDAA